MRKLINNAKKNSIKNHKRTLYYNLNLPSQECIIPNTSSPSLTTFEEGDFILEEIKACLTNDSIPPGIDDGDFDPEGDLLLLEKLLNDDPSSPFPPKELHVEELKIVKYSIDDPSELELKDLPSHLEYAFLEGTDKLPVIIAKDLKEDEKVRLLKNLAFLSSENTSSTNEVNTASGDFRVSTAGGISQIDEDDLEELDLRWQVDMLTVRALVAQDGLGGYDWSNDFEIKLVNYALMAISSSTSSSSFDNEVQKCSKQCLKSFKTLQKNLIGYGTQLNEMSNNSKTDSEISLSVFDVRSSDEEFTPANDRSSKADGCHVVPPPIIGNFSIPRADISFAVNRDKVIIEDWNSDDEDDVSEVQTVSPVKTNETQTVKTRVDKIGQTSQKQGIGFKKIKACFVCKSTDHLIKDCNFHDKQSQEPKLKIVVQYGPRADKPVWDNTKRGNSEILLQDHAVVDSGCSSHMTGNKAYLSDMND
ncbi:hypothetical protein Tco_0628845 [Tanacetum coccineum]|uniref:Reverse transcriptase domain-containing protein n=1 Tax=Tanacetum coccineum TaxID=301880 RepID=A0ABQ4WRJ8_9ASTR